MIANFAKIIPRDLYGRSGAVFYSGKAAFEGQKDLYILGLNPGGSPKTLADMTIARHTQSVLNSKPSDWSEYEHEKWAGGRAGTAGMQPRVLHMLSRLGLSAGRVPSSNVVFVRTARESDLAAQFLPLAELCWPFHEAVIRALEVRVVLCFGQRCGNWVRRRLDAEEKPVDEFVERNERRSGKPRVLE